MWLREKLQMKISQKMIKIFAFIFILLISSTIMLFVNPCIEYGEFDVILLGVVPILLIGILLHFLFHKKILKYNNKFMFLYLGILNYISAYIISWIILCIIVNFF